MEDKDFTIYNGDEEITPETIQEEVQIAPQEETQPDPQPQEEKKSSLLGSLLTEGESEGEGVPNIKELVKSVNINSQWFMRQIPLLLIIVIGMMAYVTNRYAAQQELIDKAKLEEEVDDWKYRSLTRSSELTEQTRQSQIEEMLKARGDSTLQPSTEPAYTLNPEQ